jgi:hypothetical protein
LGARNPKGINRIATYNYISVWTLILGVWLPLWYLQTFNEISEMLE